MKHKYNKQSKDFMETIPQISFGKSRQLIEEHRKYVLQWFLDNLIFDSVIDETLHSDFTKVSEGYYQMSIITGRQISLVVTYYSEMKFVVFELCHLSEKFRTQASLTSTLTNDKVYLNTFLRHTFDEFEECFNKLAW